MTRRVAILLTALLLVTLAGGAYAWAAGRRPPSQPAGVEQVHRFYGGGPSARYNGDVGGIGVVPPLTFTVTEAQAQAGVVEIAFSYRTVGPGPFVLSAGIEDEQGHDVVVRPDQVPLAQASHATTTTVRFLAPVLEAGRTYRVRWGVNSSFRQQGTNKITTRHGLVTVGLE